MLAFYGPYIFQSVVTHNELIALYFEDYCTLDMYSPVTYRYFQLNIPPIYQGNALSLTNAYY